MPPNRPPVVPWAGLLAKRPATCWVLVLVALENRLLPGGLLPPAKMLLLGVYILYRFES